MQDQKWVSPKRGLPVDDTNTSSATVSITGETSAFNYSNSGVITADAGQLAGVAVFCKLAYDNIQSGLGSRLGYYGDTSLSFTSTAFTTEVPCNFQTLEEADFQSPSVRLSTLTSGLSNGQYIVDYRTGNVYGKKATTQTSLTAVAYKIKQSVSGGSASSPSVVTGNVAAAATDSGNPVKVGAVYNSTAPTYTNGQRTDLQSDSLGNLQENLYTQIFGEDPTNNLLGTQNKPVAVSTYAWSIDRSTALEASSISKAAAGVVRAVDGRIDSTAATGTYYIQLLNSATLPADGAVTTLIAPKKIQHTTGTDTNFSIDCTMNGVYSSAGIVIVLSTTEYTKTIGGAYISSTVYYI